MLKCLKKESPAYLNKVVSFTTIGFKMEFEGNAYVKVYNMVGQKIQVKASGTLAKGTYQVR